MENQEIDWLALKIPKTLPGAKRLQIELFKFHRLNPSQYVSAEPRDDSLFECRCSVLGPVGSVYEKGRFYIDVDFSRACPFVAPKFIFTTPIYHCNFGARGEIDLHTLVGKWNSGITVSNVLWSIFYLMAKCNPDNPVRPGIAQECKENRDAHDYTCCLHNKYYAIRD